MKSLAGLWHRVERPAIYAALGVFILTELLAFFIPVVDEFAKERGGLLLIATVLLAIFRFIDERLAQPALASPQSFGELIKHVVGGQSLIDRVDVFAHSSTKYYQFIRDSGCKIRTMRILLCGPAMNGTVPFPQLEDQRLALSQQSEAALNNWRRLQRDGLIESLAVRAYEFWPMVHFIVADNKRAGFGFFEPSATGPGAAIVQNYTASDASAATGLVQSLTHTFESVFAVARVVSEHGDHHSVLSGAPRVNIPRVGDGSRD